jgi:CheY-like chemotaxis protein
MAAPRLPREISTAAAALAAPAKAMSQDRVSLRDHRASDWICVAAARDILVVDDNDRHLDVLSAILTSVGHEVETCGSGAAALGRTGSRHFDVVVLDLVMPEVSPEISPEISGVAVARRMRDIGPNRETPIIICTAKVMLARRQLAGIPGIVGIIGKPIDTASLILAIARAPILQRTRRVGDDQPEL